MQPSIPPAIPIPGNFEDQHDSIPSENQHIEEKVETILNRLNSLEGTRGTMDPAQFCIVTDLEIPKDFKVPDFVDKYDGTEDPPGSHFDVLQQDGSLSQE